MSKLRVLLRRGTAMLLLVVMLVGILPVNSQLGVKEAKADSNSLRETYIQLMSGASAVNVTDIDSLTVNDLRCIALYLSNFYIPYATSLDDTEQQEKNEQYMVNALKNIGFKDDAARSLIKTVYSSSLSTAQPLYIRLDEISALDISATLAPSPVGLIPLASVGVTQELGLGSGDKLVGIKYAKDESDTSGVQFVDKFTSDGSIFYPLTIFAYNCLQRRYAERVTANMDLFNVFGVSDSLTSGRVPIEFYWKDGGTPKTCFILNDFTSSFIKEFADSVDLSDGSGGMAMLSTSCEDFVTLKEKEAEALATFTQRLYVDWVGNILCDFGDRRVIIYPACMNPCAFDLIGDGNESAETTDDDTEDDTEDDEEEEDGETITDTQSVDEVGGANLGNHIYNSGEPLTADQQQAAGGDGSGEPLTGENVSNETENPSDGTTPAVPPVSSVSRLYLESTERNSAFSVVSTWGMWFTNTLGCAVDDTYFSYTNGDRKDWEFLMYVGSGTKANWKKGEIPGAKRTKEILDGWGYSTGNLAGDGKWWWPFDDGVDQIIPFYSYNFVLPRDKVLSDILVYANVDNKKIQELNSGSLFLTADMFDVGKEAFTQTNKFTVKSDDFSGYMQFTDRDYVVLKNIFLTYVFAYNNRKATSFDAKSNYINMKFCADNFPESTDTSIVWDSLDTDNEKITSFIYYLLHPWEGVDYVTTLFKNKLSGILVGFHEDIVGGTESNSTTGMTKYLGFTGYVTSPSLREIDWIDNLLSSYSSIVVYLIVAMCIVICCYLITGQMRPGRAILGVIFFGIMAFVPSVALNYTADKVNLFCDTVYSNKFDYWAYTQLETYLTKLSSAQLATSTTDYIAQLMDLQTNEEVGSSIGFSGVKLKWMTPKKTHVGVQAQNELNSALDTGPEGFSSLFVSILGNSISSMDVAEDYVDAVGATYLYRDICDIYMYAACSYNLYNSFDSEGVAEPIGEGTENKWDPTDRYLAGQLTYSSGEYLGNYVMPNFKSYSREDDSIYNVTSSGAAASLGFLHDNNIDADSSAKYKYTSGTYVPSNEAYVNQDSGLALGFPFGYVHVYEQIHNNYENLLEFLDTGIAGRDDNGSEELNLDTLGYRIFGLSPETFDFGLQQLKNYSSSEGVSSDNPESSNKARCESEKMSYDTLSGYYYALYAESPFYFFNNHFRDYVVSHHPTYAFSYPIQARNTTLYQLFLENNQDYFFNYATTAGAGYGELRDFMGMHDLFYYVMPMLDEGNKIADLFDENFGMYVNEDIPLKISRQGTILYGSKEFDSFENMLDALSDKKAGSRAVKDSTGRRELNSFEELTPEQIYKLWHDYNVWTIFQSYVPWLDTMEDCKYAKPETLQIAGEKFEVTNPLDPTCYYSVDDSGTISEGRLMVFSRSEMKYYGLGMGDLTTVERKIIEVQDNVYKNALDLMNYYTLSDEVLINAFSMLQVFEFNKAFSQDSVLGQSYIMYPQGYEAKAFTYDAYLRLVVAEASGEPLQVNQNNNTDTSIYRRIMKNTSVFFGVALLVNDILAVYIIPVMKVAILVMLFFTSVFLITGAAIKIELNPVKTIWSSLLAPLGSYLLVCLGFSWIVSLFMSNGAEGVVKTSQTITIGDPTTVLLIMIFIHAVVMILLFKICRKCFKDLKTSFMSVADSITATAIGAATVLGKTLTGQRLRRQKTENGQPGGMPSSPSQRGAQNTSAFGSALGGGLAGGLAGAMAGGALGEATKDMTGDALEVAKRENERYAAKKGMNRFDKKAYEGANAREDKIRAKEDRVNKKLQQADNRGDTEGKVKYKARADKLQERREAAKKYADNLSNKGRLYAEKERIVDKAKGVASAVGNIPVAAGTAMGKVDKLGKNVKTGVSNVAGKVGGAVGSARGFIDNATHSPGGAVQYSAQAVSNLGRKAVSSASGAVHNVANKAVDIGQTSKRRFDIARTYSRGY